MSITAVEWARGAPEAKHAKRLTRKVAFDAPQPRVDEADNFNASLIVRQLLKP